MIRTGLPGVPRRPPDTRAPFDAGHLAGAPARQGVYLLYRGQRLVYIGLAAGGTTIRAELLRHLRGVRGACTRSATDFDCEASADAPTLYRHYLAVYLDATGGVLPDCHEETRQ